VSNGSSSKSYPPDILSTGADGKVILWRPGS
jgi:hypothetical protein